MNFNEVRPVAFKGGDENGNKLLISRVLLISLICCFALLSSFKFNNLSWFYLYRQDVRILLVLLLLALAIFWNITPRAHHFRVPRTVPIAAGLLAILICFAGHKWLLSGYDLSRDEQMAVFDAAILSSGQVVQPIAELWRDDSDALNTLFMYPAERRGAWVSAYLPMNAAIRVLIDQVAVAELTGPLVTGLGAIALWYCVRRIWPEDREAPLIAMLLYLGSGQIMFAGMTAFAMPAHLTLNLIWLWLFLQRRLLTDTLALLVGFVAVGLHQPIMHPLFAGPILCMLLWERSWIRAGLYLGGYSLIGLFWMAWPGWIWGMVQAGGAVSQPAGVNYLSRLIETLTEGDPQSLQNMGANLVRFLAWQHLLLAPLLIIGFKTLRSSALAMALAGGLVLMPIVMLIILPFQGYGFGYRYLHGFIGNAILLGIFGWVSLGEAAAEWRSLLMRATIGGAVVIFPLQAWLTYAGYKPFVQLSQRVSEMDVDYVIIGRTDAPYLVDLALNDPELSRRPIRLVREEIKPALIAALCAKPATVGFLSSEMVQPVRDYFASAGDDVDVRNQPVARMFKDANCIVREAST